DNGLVQARFDRRGRLIALRVDGVAVGLTGPVDVLLYPDNPANFEAWDIDHATVALGVPAMPEVELSVGERGPVRASLRVSGTIGAGSAVTISYTLDAGSRWLQVEVELDWREERSLLKAHIPTAYRGRAARYGTPFGSVARPQQPSGQSEEAMWEVPASRWAAVTNDDGEGLAVVTEASYGFGCRDGELTLSLVRHATSPDPKQDLGQHRIRFALGRHQIRSHGEILATAAAADALFTPPIVVAGGELTQPLVELEQLGSLVPAWIAPERAGEGWVLRLHETAGARGTAIMRLATQPKAIELIDLLERRIGGVKKRSPRAYEITYEPYQLLSVRVR
ncbi:MAG: hypothetical protein H0X45_01860, partial [Planctomycetes bacterium]|nr:hypothetical protein [Planctomycetota bacterium]